MTQADYNIFVSWSGPKSKQVAAAFRVWLPKVIQIARPWMSDEDIVKGRQWTTSIRTRLDKSNFGIICLTPENLRSPWLLFEAGALSKPDQDAYVWTYLTDLKPTDVEDPLAQYQATEFDKSDIRKLVQAIRSAIDTEGLISEDSVAGAFEAFWEDLNAALSGIVAPEAAEAGLSDEREPLRPDRALLEEILARLRSNDIEDARRSATDDPDNFYGDNDVLGPGSGPTFLRRVKAQDVVMDILERDDRVRTATVLKEASKLGIDPEITSFVLENFVFSGIVEREGNEWVKLPPPTP